MSQDLAERFRDTMRQTASGVVSASKASPLIKPSATTVSRILRPVLAAVLATSQAFS